MLMTMADTWRAGNESESEIYTPWTDHTDSAEVLQLARFWLHRCTGPEHPECPSESFGGQIRKYPTRLIELPPYDLGTDSAAILAQTGKGSGSYDKIKKEYVRLVESEGCTIRPYQVEDHTRAKTSRSRRASTFHHTLPIHPRNESTSTQTSKSRGSRGFLNAGGSRPRTASQVSNASGETDLRGEYVTLSHCWGKARIPTLMSDNLEAYQSEFGIPLASLPRTFQQAIRFAQRLSRSIRYIWIDSLCIIQDDDEDWERESVKMYDVYRNAYCNISATNASNSSEGLFFGRNPQLLWENEVNLNTDGIPRPMNERVHKSHLGLEPLIRRCTIHDASFWDRKVDDAPVNRRAWVLQERLLAPRVLHFCKDQIAWECRHVDASESSPYGLSTMTMEADRITERSRLKALVPGNYGAGSLAPDAGEVTYDSHEKWKSIVERYSITALTKPEDKLIALAGIAELMSAYIGSNVLYVAGMWEKYLASQLLWRVKSKYEDDRFKYPQRRAISPWRAPTFSWAAIDAPQGIICGETVREGEMWISVDGIHVESKAIDREFGLVQEGCHLRLTCILKRIKISQAIRVEEDAGMEERAKSVRYVWQLDDHSVQVDRSAFRDPTLSNLYLDSPKDDFKDIQDTGTTFCIPAREDDVGQIICLIVQRIDQDSPVNDQSVTNDKLSNGVSFTEPFPSRQVADDHRIMEGQPKSYRRVGLAIVPRFEMAKFEGHTEDHSIRSSNSDEGQQETILLW